jgi:hypothetical protein
VPGISISDIDKLPDPALEQDVLMLLVLCNKKGELEKDTLSHFMLGNRWSKSKVKRIVKHALDNGMLSDQSELCITDKGRKKIGGN